MLYIEVRHLVILRKVSNFSVVHPCSYVAKVFSAASNILTGLYEVSEINYLGISYTHCQNKIVVEFNSHQGSWVFSDMKNQKMASIKVDDPDGNYLPTHGLGTVIKLNRRSGSLIIGSVSA